MIHRAVAQPPTPESERNGKPPQPSRLPAADHTASGKTYHSRVATYISYAGPVMHMLPWMDVCVGHSDSTESELYMS